MARVLRIKRAGGRYHVTARGNERKAICRKGRDGAHFLELLGISPKWHDTSVRPWKITQPDNTNVTNEYLLTGELERTYGSRTYPVAYTYDYAGQDRCRSVPAPAEDRRPYWGASRRLER
ncbi:MAG: hypothetical protein ABSF95_17950 [Verrucomicrobiota bacterium]|jgi:hypothetical protein